MLEWLIYMILSPFISDMFVRYSWLLMENERHLITILTSDKTDNRIDWKALCFNLFKWSLTYSEPYGYYL